MATRLPNLPLLKPVVDMAEGLVPKYINDIVSNIEDHGNFAIIKKPTCTLGPAMVNDGCPLISAIGCALGGELIQPLRVVNGELVGDGFDRVRGKALGIAVHKLYVDLVRQFNPGWVIQSDVHYEAVIEYDGEELMLSFTPDILMGWNGEWHVVEVKAGRPQASHLLQLALYWYLLKDYYRIVMAWLVTKDAITPYKPGHMGSIVRRGLDYLVTVKRILDRWSNEDISDIRNCQCIGRIIDACSLTKQL